MIMRQSAENKNMSIFIASVFSTIIKKNTGLLVGLS